METNTKKIMKTLTVVLALATATVTEGFAQAKTTSGEISASAKITNLNVQDLGNLRFKLAFENPLRSKTQIALFDKNNEVFFSDYSVGDAKYSKAFDLSNLTDGEYTFVVGSGKDKLTQTFVISTKIFRGISLANNRK